MYCDSDDECYNKNKASNNDGTKYDEDDTVTAQQRRRDSMYKRGRGSSTVYARRFNLSAQIKCGFRHSYYRRKVQSSSQFNDDCCSVG